MKQLYTLGLGLALTFFTVSAQQRVAGAPSHQLLKTNKAALFSTRQKADTKTKVLFEKKVSEGIFVRTIADVNGRIFKQIERNGITTPPPEKRSNLPRRANTDQSLLYEGFESYLDYPHSSWVEDWLPEDWTEINTDAHFPDEYKLAAYINNTWHAGYTGDGYWTDITTDGECECFIHFTYPTVYAGPDGEDVSYPNEPQDEWLVSPQFTMQQNYKLFFDAEIDAGSIFSYDWNTREYDRSLIDHSLEVLISDDQGVTWTKIWDAVEEIAAPLSDAELYDQMASLKYHTYVVEIPETYNGKEVQLAFRYLNAARNGICGNSMGIDAINVSLELPEARYTLPHNTLLAGISEDFYITSAPFALFPNDAEITWPSCSNNYTESVEWTFNSPEGEDVIITDTEAKVAFPYSNQVATLFPTLKAMNQFGEDVFRFGDDLESQGGVLYGGSIPSEQALYPVGNYDYAHGSVWAAYFGYSFEGNYIYGISPENAWGNGIREISAADRFAKPGAPFAVDKIMLTLGLLDADADAELTLNIYKYNSDGTLGIAPVASTVARIGDATEYPEAGLYNLTFNFYDDENNPTYFVYDDEMLVEITGFTDNDKIRKLAMCSQGVSKEPGYNTAYVLLEQQETGDRQWYAISEALLNHHNSLYISLFGSYNFLHPESNSVEFTSDASLNVESPVSSSEWWIEYEGQKYALSAPVCIDWLNVESLETNSNKALKFSADSSSTDREINLVLATKGASAPLLITQKESSGISATAQEKLMVKYVDGKVVVSGIDPGIEINIFSADGILLEDGISNHKGEFTSNKSISGHLLIVKAGSHVAKLMSIQ